MFHLSRQLIAWSLLAAALGSAAAQSTGDTVSLVAGHPQQPGYADGTGTAALFYSPQGIAFDSAGNLYVADTGNACIREIDGQSVVTIAGKPDSPGNAVASVAAGASQFNAPSGIAVDSAGNVYVGDSDNSVIRKISGGIATIYAGEAETPGYLDATTGTQAQFGSPYGLALDGAGNLYVADEGTDTIRKIAKGTGAVTTIAGTGRSPGSTDGPALNGALFSHPEAVAVDGSGNVYVADTGNDTIRMVSGGTVTTIAGQAGAVGSADGTGSAARFYSPWGIAVDASGELYVADSGNDTIRKLTPNGGSWMVTTIAGSVGTQGYADETGAAANFAVPSAVAATGAGVLYITDFANDCIREAVGPTTFAITSQPQNQTAILGGSVTFQLVASGTSPTYQWELNGTAINNATSSSYTVNPVTASNSGPSNSYTVVVTSSGNSVASNPVTITVNNDTAPTVTTPASQTANAGATATFSVTGTGGGLAYQWYFNGSSIPGATSSSLVLSNVGTEQAGFYAVGVTNDAGSAISSNAQLAVNYSAQLINLSARAFVSTGNSILIGGLSIGGSATKNVLLRGDGPALQSQVSDFLAAPQLTLFDNHSTAIVADAGWQNALTTGSSTVSVSPQAATAPFMNGLGASPTFASGSADSALEAFPPAGSYTFEITGAGGATGVSVAEIYDAAPSSGARLTNISARAGVGTGSNILIGGFVITGTTSETILIRGDGPALQSQLSGTLATPEIVLVDSGGNTIATNIGWGDPSTRGNSSVQAGIQPATTTVMNGVGASPAFAAGSADCAMVATLPAGAYTVEMAGVGGAIGIGLIEIYEVP